MNSGALGIIELANRPLTFVGNVGNPRSYPYPVMYETAERAYVKSIVTADPSLERSYCEAALRLQARGARAIISNCGFAVRYQRAVAACVDVPALLSPLLLLPMALKMAAPAKQVAILTYDGTQLDARFLEEAGVDAADPRLMIAGIEGSESWRDLAAENPRVSSEQLASDIRDALGRALKRGSEIGAVLVECSAFCPLRDEIRRAAKVPAFDFLFLADLVMGAAGGTLRGSYASPAIDAWRDGPDAFGFLTAPVSSTR